jgi:hypothetical protein
MMAIAESGLLVHAGRSCLGTFQRLVSSAIGL